MDDHAREWHKNHKMPKNPSLDERIEWAVEHAKHCGCRPIPKSLLDEIKKRKIQISDKIEK